MNAPRTGLYLALALLSACASNTLGRVDQDNAVRQALAAPAERGDSQAQFELGEAYCCGSGFYSTAEAIRWWCRAAEQGHKGALQRLREHVSAGLQESCRRHDPGSDYSFATPEESGTG